MSEQYNFEQGVIEALNKENAPLTTYLNSDARLQENQATLVSKINSFDFNKMIQTSKGVREIHYINYNEDKIPMRLLSIAEERNILHQCHVLFKKYPEFIGGEDNPIFQEFRIIKTLSLATSPCPELFEDKDRYFTEAQLENISRVTLNYLSHHYDQLTKQYNFLYNEAFEEEITYALHTLFDGGELINEKKLILLNGLSSVQKSAVIIRLLKTITKHEDNAAFITLLEKLKQNEIEEKSFA